MHRFLGICCWLAAALAAPTAAAQDTDFVVSNVYVDNVRQPKSIIDLARDCADNAACMAAVEAAEAYFQVPAGEVVKGAAALAPSAQGEGTYVTANLPAGYAYCGASMKMVSIVPHDGDRGSLFLGMAKPNALYFETWTPVQPFGGGRSWVEAAISILGIRQDLAAQAYANGTCHVPERVLWYCRGGGCVDTADEGQSRDSSSPPGAGSAK